MKINFLNLVDRFFDSTRFSVILLPLIFIWLGIINSQFLTQPPQHFDWIASFPDAYLPDQRVPHSFDEFIKLLIFTFTENTWLYRPAATFILALNQAVFGYETQFITGLYFISLSLSVLLISLTQSERSINVYIFLGGLLAFHPQQPLLMIYSTEVLLGTFLVTSIICISKSFQTKSSSLLTLGFFVLLIASGFKEIGVIAALSISISYLILLVYFRSFLGEKYLRIALFMSLCLIIYTIFAIFMILSGKGTAGLDKSLAFFSIGRVFRTFLYILPIHTKFIYLSLFNLIFVGILILALYGLLTKLYKLFHCPTITTDLSSLALGVLSLAAAFAMYLALCIDSPYPPRSSPRYVHPIFAMLLLFIASSLPFITIRVIRQCFMLSVLIIFLITSLHGSSIQLKRSTSFFQQSSSFHDAINFIANNNDNTCFYYLEIDGIYNEVDLALRRSLSSFINQYRAFSSPITLKRLSSSTLSCDKNAVITSHSPDQVFHSLRKNGFVAHSAVEFFSNRTSVHNTHTFYESGTLPSGSHWPLNLYYISKGETDIYHDAGNIRELISKIRDDECVIIDTSLLLIHQNYTITYYPNFGEALLSFKNNSNFSQYPIFSICKSEIDRTSIIFSESIEKNNDIFKVRIINAKRFYKLH